MRSPFFRCLTIWLTRPPRMASACFFESSLSSATLAARCFNVTVVAGCVAIRPSSIKRWRAKTCPSCRCNSTIRLPLTTLVLPIPPMLSRILHHSYRLRGTYTASEKGRFWLESLTCADAALIADRARGGVAQLVRASACHAEGRGFESRRSRHNFNDLAGVIEPVPTFGLPVPTFGHSVFLPIAPRSPKNRVPYARKISLE